VTDTVAPGAGTDDGNARIAGFLALAVAILLGVIGLVPHLGESLWQDEAKTIAFHASRGALDSILHYGSPNNHMGFSALLAGWMQLFPDGVDLPHLRALPAIFFLLAICLTFATGTEIGGTTVGGIAAILFSTSAATLNFATQLRGYCPSWAVGLIALLAALRLQRRGWRGIWPVMYALATLAFLLLLPSNLYLSLLMAGSVIAAHWPGRRARVAYSPGVAAFLVIVPVAAFGVAYGHVWSELVSFSRISFSDWSREDLLQAWLAGSLYDSHWLPGAFGAACFAWAAGFRGPAQRGVACRQQAAIAACFTLGFLLLVIVMPTRPFPRTLVPFLPMWFCAVAIVLARGFESLPTVRAWVAGGLGFFLLAAPALVQSSNMRCDGPPRTSSAFDYDLCHQYFRDNYHPELVLDAWAELGQPGTPLVADFEGYYALSSLGSAADIRHFSQWRAGDSPPIIVAHDTFERDRIADTLGVKGLEYAELADTGYFDVYAPTRRP
jgi:hypothetical protein